MTAKKTALVLILVYLSLPALTYGQIEPIGQLMVNKGLARINKDSRKRIAADMVSVEEEYDNKEKYAKKETSSSKTGTKTILGRPKLDRMDIDELYTAFATHFDFYIDNADSTAVVETIDKVKINCVVIKFRPKPNMPFKDYADQFINKLTGAAYINLDDFQIVKIEGVVNYHFNFDYKLLGFIPIRVDVYEFGFSLEYAVFNDIVIERYLTGMADYEIRNRGIKSQTYTLSNYRIR